MRVRKGPFLVSIVSRVLYGTSRVQAYSAMVWMANACFVRHPVSRNPLSQRKGAPEGPFFPASNLVLIRHCLQLGGDGEKFFLVEPRWFLIPEPDVPIPVV